MFIIFLIFLLLNHIIKNMIKSIKFYQINILFYFAWNLVHSK
jgi:hypothetical protein